MPHASAPGACIHADNGISLMDPSELCRIAQVTKRALAS